MKISIIIATYNASTTLKRCLDSIVPQLTPETELILVDGNSKDNTNEIIASFGDKVSVHISEPDNGIYDAWNKGIKVAKGDWISFIGADDLLLPGAIKAFIDVINQTLNIETYDYICAQNEYVDKEGKVLKIMGEAPKWKKFRKIMVAAHVASLHNRKNLFETIGHYDYKKYKICADYELLMRKKDKLKYIFFEKHIARMEVGGMSFSTKAIIEAFRIRKQHRSVNSMTNLFFLFRDWLVFRLFIIRKSLNGGKL